MKKLNNAFTLTELLVALGVIGILCAILLPVIFNLLPNRNTLMAKRAYYAVQTIVADMINDEACYPDLTSVKDTDKRVGFDDGYGYANCTLWGGAENTGTITSEGNANTKFITLFKDKLDLSGSECKFDDDSNPQIFCTKDGIAWAIHTPEFNNSIPPNQWGLRKNLKTLITVDVNGVDRPNCSNSTHSAQLNINTETTGSCTGVNKGYDRFTMGIYADGRIEIDANDEWATNAINVNRNVTGDGISNDTDDKLD